MDNPIKQEVEDTSIKPEANNEQQICRFCYTYEENMPEVQEKEREMMRTLCLTLDLSLTENPLICSTCRKKLEDYYNFKKTCIYTEECIAPYVVENVKVNLSEIFGCVVKCEDGMDINMCRLCMQPTDNDNTLTGEDREQFEQFFPEVNLNVTCIVVVCTKCYGLLQKLLVFMSLCLEREEKLHSYSEGEKVALENFLHFLKYQTSSKDELIDTKNEMCIEKEEMHGKSEEELDEKFSLTNTELEIKDEAEMDDTSFEAVGRKRTEREKVKSNKRKCTTKSKAITKNCKELSICPYCSKEFTSKQNLVNHITIIHSDPSELQKYYCDYCSFETVYMANVERHMSFLHSDLLGYKIYKCNSCSFKTPKEMVLKRHKCRKYYCDYCDYETIYRPALECHLLTHSDPSEREMFECEQCEFKTHHRSYINKHHYKVHRKFSGHSCDHCEFKTTSKKDLVRHKQLFHPVPARKKNFPMHKCNKCDFKCKQKRKLYHHVLTHASESLDMEVFNCKECNIEFTNRSNFYRHVRKYHPDSLYLYFGKTTKVDKSTCTNTN